MSTTRTTLSLKNAKVALIFYFISLTLNFISRKVFIDYLGAEVLGLNSTISNLLGFLNLAELGIGVAISYSLYTPLYNTDKNSIKEIITVQGYWYRKIGYSIFLAAILLSIFFPLIFSKINLPLWYAFITFFVMLSSSLFSYFWNYKQILLSADQKQYKITINRQSWTLLKIILQIAAIILTNYGYILWLVIEFTFAVIMTFSLNKLINKTYPWLKINISEGKELQKKYPLIITKTKQLFFHKIGGFVLSQTSPIIIYSYTTLTLVAIYSNYILIISGISRLLEAIFNSIGASVGNLVSQGDKRRIVKVFWELFSVRFLFTTTICLSVYKLANPFITLWIGKEYLLSNETLLIIVLIMYINTMRTVIDSFINAYGLYKDIWATIVETILNLSLSIILGYFYGINGILSGTLISLLIIIFIWKPYFCYTQGFNLSIASYIINYTKHMIGFIFVLIPIEFISNAAYFTKVDSYYDLILFAFTISSSFFLLMFFTLYCISKGMRESIYRLLRTNKI